MQTYIVQAGDSLSNIAQRFLGDRSQYRLIAEINRLRNPNAINVGQRLKIPGRGMPERKKPDFSLLTDYQLSQIMRYARPENRARFLKPLNDTMHRYGITTKLRKAHFLAQLAHESGSLKYTEELASGEAYEGRARLGNTRPGDGVRFKGRGLIQLTGRYNYTRYKKFSGHDVIRNPQLIATDANIATDVAGWFWMVTQLNKLADRDDLRTLTRRVNGGLNGLPDRQQHLEQAKRVFGIH